MLEDQAINRLPVQLLRMLGISGAESPDRLLSIVQGTLDLLPWLAYSSEQIISLSHVPGLGAVGFATPGGGAVVPAGSRWLVMRFSIRVNCAIASATAAASGAWDESLGGAVHVVGLSTPVGATPSYYGLACINGPHEWFIMGPGDRLGFNISVNGAVATITLQLAARVLQFTF